MHFWQLHVCESLRHSMIPPITVPPPPNDQITIRIPSDSRLQLITYDDYKALRHLLVECQGHPHKPQFGKSHLTFNPFCKRIMSLLSKSHTNMCCSCMAQTAIRSGNNFAHATTAKLSWHMQNCELIGSIESKLKQNEFSQDFNYEPINCL